MKNALLKIVPVSLSGPKNCINTYALLDEGSTITLIDQKILREIGVRGSCVNIAINGVTNRNAVIFASEKVEVEIQGAFDKYYVKHAVAIKDLSLPRQSISKEIFEYIFKTENVKMHAYHDAQPKILIGQDNWQLIVTREMHEIKQTELAISRSFLGWAVHGIAPRNVITHPYSEICALECEESDLETTRCKDENLDELMKNYFQLDNLGIQSTRKNVKRLNHIQDILDKTSKYLGDSWETGLLWNENMMPSVNSRLTAQKRLVSLERTLDRDPAYAQLYYNEMKRFISAGYAIKVQSRQGITREWFLPHFGVKNINKPGRIRLVFDAAARTSGIGLNDQLESGPDLLKPLHGILIRFRQYAVAFKADIKDMFLRVKIRLEDQAAQKFLWRGKNRQQIPDEYAMTSLIFGAKSSPCSAMYIKNKNAMKWSHINPEASKSIVQDFYMDDYLSSRKTERDAMNVVSGVININSKANFEMHSWASNSSWIMEGLPEETHIEHQNIMKLCDRGGESVLGLLWDTQTDELHFNVNPRKQWKIAQSLADAYWKRWLREYLPEIMPRKKWHTSENPLKIGDIVLIIDLQAPRNTWRKGTIVQVFPGADGEIRVAKIRTTMGELTRPSRRLIRLISVNEG